MSSLLLLLLFDEPVLNGGGGLAGIGPLLALDLDGHALVLLEVGGQVGLLGRLGGLGLAEGGHLADGVRVLDGGGLVGLELPQVELLDEIRWERRVSGRRGKTRERQFWQFGGNSQGSKRPSVAGAVSIEKKSRPKVLKADRFSPPETG